MYRSLLLAFLLMSSLSAKGLNLDKSVGLTIGQMNRELDCSIQPDSVDMKLNLLEADLTLKNQGTFCSLSGSLLLGAAAAEFDYSNGQGVWEVGTNASYGLRLAYRRYLYGFSDISFSFTARKTALEGNSFTDNLNNRSGLYNDEEADMLMTDFTVMLHRGLESLSSPVCTSSLLVGIHYRDTQIEMSRGWKTNGTEDMESDMVVGLDLGYEYNGPRFKGYDVDFSAIIGLIDETSFTVGASVAL